MPDQVCTRPRESGKQCGQLLQSLGQEARQGIRPPRYTSLWDLLRQGIIVRNTTKRGVPGNSTRGRLVCTLLVDECSTILGTTSTRTMKGTLGSHTLQHGTPIEAAQDAICHLLEPHDYRLYLRGVQILERPRIQNSRKELSSSVGIHRPLGLLAHTSTPWFSTKTMRKSTRNYAPIENWTVRHTWLAAKNRLHDIQRKNQRHLIRNDLMDSKATGGVKASSRRYTVHHHCRRCQQELRQIRRSSSVSFYPVYSQWKKQSAASVTYTHISIAQVKYLASTRLVEEKVNLILPATIQTVPYFLESYLFF